MSVSALHASPPLSAVRAEPSQTREPGARGPDAASTSVASWDRPDFAMWSSDVIDAARGATEDDTATGTAVDEAAPESATEDGATADETASAAGSAASDDPEAQPSGAAGEELSEEERQQVEKLRARDAEVRTHEAAHMAAGGAHVRGGATYSYQQGPDGKSYAIGGEVSIDVSPIPGNPQATIQKMQQVRAAALAPAEPSGADRSVAAAASQAEAKARQELTAKQTERAVARYAEADTADASSGSLVNEAA